MEVLGLPRRRWLLVATIVLASVGLAFVGWTARDRPRPTAPPAVAVAWTFEQPERGRSSPLPL